MVRPTDIKWDYEKRSVLLAAFLLSQQNRKAATQVWATIFPDEAIKYLSTNALLRRTTAQLGERSTKAYWTIICQSLREFSEREPALLTTVQTVLARLSANDNEVNTASLQHMVTADGVSSSTEVAHSSATVESIRHGHVQLPSGEVQPFQRMQHDSQQRQSQRAQRLTAARADSSPMPIVMESEARPGVPPILFRLYDVSDSHAVNDPFGSGFISGYHKLLNGPVSAPPRLDDQGLFNDIEHHVCGRLIHSKWISVSSNLLWILVRAFELASGGKNIRVALINGISAAGSDGSHVIHPRPFYAILKDRLCYDPGKWRHAGNSEILVWHRISREAIIGDFSVAHLGELLTSTVALSSTFRPQVFGRHKSSTKIRGVLKADGVLLDRISVTAIVEFLNMFLALFQQSAAPLDGAAVITTLVAEIVQGWHLRPAGELSTAGWRELAGIFIDEMRDRAPGLSISPRELAESFLFGVYAGFGETHWALSDELKKRMVNVARSYGLSNPTAVYQSRAEHIRNILGPFILEATPLGRKRAPVPTSSSTPNQACGRSDKYETGLDTTPLSTPTRTRSTLTGSFSRLSTSSHKRDSTFWGLEDDESEYEE